MLCCSVYIFCMIIATTNLGDREAIKSLPEEE